MIFKIFSLAVSLAVGVLGCFLLAYLYYNVMYKEVYDFFYINNTWGKIAESMRSNTELLLKGLPLLMAGLFIIMLVIIIFGSELESKRIEYRY